MARDSSKYTSIFSAAEKARRLVPWPVVPNGYPLPVHGSRLIMGSILLIDVQAIS